MKKIITVLLITSIIYLSGCEALRKKFTRQPKKKEKEIEDIVFVPVEYPEFTMSKEDQYTNNYLFWKSWHSELVTYLNDDTSRKKQISLADETINSLNNMRELLNDEKREKLDVYIKELEKIHDKLKNTQFVSMPALKRKTINLQNKIQREFYYGKAIKYLR